MSAERVQAMFAAACLARSEDVLDLAADPAAFVARHGLAPEDAAAVAASARRLGLYRKLVRWNLTHVVGVMLERTRARFEALAPGRFDATVEAFLAEVGPRTPHLRDVPAELLGFAAPRWRADPELAPFLVEHAEVELVEFTVGVTPRVPSPEGLAEVAVDRPLVFAEPVALVTTGHAVHELPEADLRAVPERRATTLLVYRDEAHRSRFLELTPVAASLFERLRAGSPLGAALAEACAARGVPLDDGVLAGAARLLADLAERGVLLGAR